MSLEMNAVTEAVSFLPDKLRVPILRISDDLKNEIKEIRIRRRCPVAVITHRERVFVRMNGTISLNDTEQGLCVAENNDVDDAVRRLCSFSIHAFQNEMKNGYITVSGGHRVGIAATSVLNEFGKITTIKNVSSLNIRIAREIAGAADDIINNVFYDKIRSLLIVGEPASGKTTVLRDLAFRLSGPDFDYRRVCIVDERSEIAAVNLGVSVNKLGAGCDVLDGYPKSDGMLIALRAMSPDVIICDEIGSDSDVYAIENVANAGVKLIATIHAESFSKLTKRPQFQKLMSTGAFDVAAVLSGKHAPGIVREVVSLKRYWK